MWMRSLEHVKQRREYLDIAVSKVEGNLTQVPLVIIRDRVPSPGRVLGKVEELFKQHWVQLDAFDIDASGLRQ